VIDDDGEVSSAQAPRAQIARWRRVAIRIFMVILASSRTATA
jgi:hypothetical protein